MDFQLRQAFLDTSKKTQAQKTQNSRKILKKLKQNSKKKLKNRQLQLSWVGAKLNENLIYKVLPKTAFLSSNIFKN